MAHRYFTTEIQGEHALITGGDAVHLAKVLRVKQGEQLMLCDGAGTDYSAVVQTVTLQQVELKITARTPSAAEPDMRAVLYIGYAKGERLEWALQKATELGAVGMVPFFSEYCVVKPKNEEAKNERYRRIVLEAAKQSGRGVVPWVSMPLSFDEMLQQAAKQEKALFFYEKGGLPLRDVLQDITSMAVITGPEGGFSEQEAAKARDAGCLIMGLGPRILRCETAPVAALAAVMALTGNLG